MTESQAVELRRRGVIAFVVIAGLAWIFWGPNTLLVVANAGDDAVCRVRVVAGDNDRALEALAPGELAPMLIRVFERDGLEVFAAECEPGAPEEHYLLSHYWTKYEVGYLTFDGPGGAPAFSYDAP